MKASAQCVTEVAVGVLIREGCVLFVQRPPGKFYEGYWEFPGGKLEDQESVEQALTRELKEELGIHIQSVKRWHVLAHRYPHANVRLHFCWVEQWEGELIAQEGQTGLSWQKLPTMLEPILPATIPLLALLADALSARHDI